MVKIIPCGQRNLTRKSLAKLWNLFPNDEFCMTGIEHDLKKLPWYKFVATYYTIRGKDFSVEINPIKNQFELIHLLKVGVRKFYFPWSGIEQGLLLASSDVIQVAIWITENYEDAEVTIIYEIPYDQLFHLPDFDLIETSIIFLGKTVNSKPRLHALFRRVHPWYGSTRIERLEEYEKLALEQGNFEVENKCGCLTVAPNTSIYCCPFCERKPRKKRFGDADRDPFVVGTVDRGIFRCADCKHCELFPKAKDRRISYI